LTGDQQGDGAGREDAVLSGGGEVSALMRAIDWSATPLGPVESWPQSLKTCVRVVLTSRQPMFIWWGDRLINLYNDAYRSILGGKHPWALGRPASEVWREVWDQIVPRAASAMRADEGTYDEALLFIVERNGYPEETYYTFSYSPVPNDRGGTGGILCANTDDTRRIVGERQIALLRDLAADVADARTASEACERSVRALGTNPRDLPFALLYMVDAAGGRAVLAGASGIEPGHPAAPAEAPVEGAAPWPFAEVLAAHEPRVVELTAAFGALPSGAWPRPPSRAVALPIVHAGQAGRAGVLVVGLNPYRLFDEGYRDFLGLAAGQIAAGIAGAQAYEEERRRAEALAEIDRAKTAFFQNISHEFRTPLTLLLGPLEDALAAPGRSLAGEGLTAAHRNALRLLRLVNALLDFARIEEGRAQAAYVPTDLATLTADLASGFRAAVEGAGLRLTVECPPLPEPVYVDPRMWEKVVLNLLSNAFKFTFEGGITVALRAAGGRAELSVSDTGTGVPAHELPRLFERFHRVEGARSRSFEGTGIGLALVHELVRLHGGAIAVESEFGRGTTFTVAVPFGAAHLPADRVEAGGGPARASEGARAFVEEALRWLPEMPAPAAGPSRPEAPAPGPEAEAPPPARVLLADDNADMRAYVRRLLSERFEVEAVADGVAALAAARARTPDLVLTDVMMPGLDGFGLLRALRADPATRGVPVVMLSARAGGDATIEGLEAGADDYLVKPFAARELLARVTLHLELARTRGARDAQRRRLYELVTHAPAAVAVLRGPEHVHELANEPYRALVGGRELVGRTVRETVPEAEKQGYLALLDRVYATGEPFVGDERRFLIDEPGGTPSEHIFNFVFQPTRDGEGRVDGVVTFGFDISAQVRARRQIEALAGERAELLARAQQARAEAEAARAVAEGASRMKDEFLATVSHELRTPLNSMLGWASMLRSDTLDPPTRARALETIERSARAQSRLIEDLLDLARILQGKFVLSVGPVELVRVVEAALDTVRPAAEAKGVRLQPVLDSHATIVGDAERLQQVAWNLLSNAIKFTPRGGRVLVSLRRAPSYVELSVADTGQGIGGEFLPHVFEPFRQADGSITRRAGGLGLGLSIVRSLVELHGGTVSAASDGPGEGATFVVRLPMAPLRAERAPNEAAEPAPEATGRATFECPPALAGLRVLVVDDEPDTQALLAFLLEQCRARVTAVGSAAEALARLERSRFDVLVSDVGMPGEDGLSLVRRVRELPPEQGGRIPAVALTAYARGEDRARALRAGFNMHLAKPIEPNELVLVVAALVANARA
jgi:signal transduction histidine kinase